MIPTRCWKTCVGHSAHSGGSRDFQATARVANSWFAPAAALYESHCARAPRGCPGAAEHSTIAVTDAVCRPQVGTLMTRTSTRTSKVYSTVSVHKTVAFRHARYSIRSRCLEHFQLASGTGSYHRFTGLFLLVQLQGGRQGPARMASGPPRCHWVPRHWLRPFGGRRPRRHPSR